MDDLTKCEIYTKLLNSLNKNRELKEEISQDTYINQIRLIKTDLLSKGNGDKETALQMLKILIENNVQDIQGDVITILRDTTVDQEVRNSIFNSIRNYIQNMLQTNDVTSLASLYVYWKNYDLQKFYELLESASLQESQDDSQLEPINFSNLIVEYFLPMMSSPNQIHLKQPLIEVATKIAEMYPISNSTAEQYQEVLKKIPDLLSNIVNLQKSNDNVWREPLHFLTEYLDKKLFSPEVQEMFSNSSLNWDLVRIDLESNINIELIKYISENNLTLTAILFRGWKNLDPQKFTKALKEICQNDIYIESCKTFLFDKLIPVVMAPKDMSDPMKVYYIDIALEFVSTLPLTKLNPEEYNRFFENVNDYIKHISDLRDMQFAHWHKLWIILVRLFGKKLHHSLTLINRLLRVVEHAFRNSSYVQRIRGYDCWKELIDNVSLDSHHISSEKQIRLLLTPLRAKFSKQEAVIIKRFEVFVYLIEKLQNKAVLVLKEFLEFCFGDVGEDTDPNKSGQGKSLPDLWPRSAKVLLAMLGHSHDSIEHCVETSTEICLKGPVLNSDNISNHYCHAINSVLESCILLKDVEFQDKNTVLKCFWTSLLGIVLNDTVTKKDKCIDRLNKVVERLLQNNDPYHSIIAAEILRSTIRIDGPKVFPFVLSSLEHFTKIIFLVPLNNESHLDVEKFQLMLCTAESPDVKSKIIQNLFYCFSEYQTLENNANYVAQFWIFLANELDDYAKNKCLNFLIWPALHIHHVTDSAKQVVIYEHYKQYVTKFVEKSEELQLGVFKQFAKIIKNNPLLIKNVVTLVTMFAPKTNNKELTNISLDILDVMMVVPAADDSGNQRQNMELYLKKLFELNITNIHDPDTIQKLCACLQHVLRYKHFDILPAVSASLTALPEDIKWLYVKFLSLDFLMDVFEKESDVFAAEKIHKLIDVFRNVKNPEVTKDVTTFIPRGGRSAKIAKLVKEIPHSPGKRCDSPTTLRLFGKDIDTLSPLSVKGSQLRDSPSTTKLKNVKDIPNKSKTSTPTRKSKVCIDDESNSKFVLIETKVSLDKSKLTEHQKEALTKRREDIPALYQDLSQSMTQSLDSSVSKKIADIIGVFKIPDENCNKEIEQSLNVEPEQSKSLDDFKTDSDTKSSSKVQEPSFEIKENESMSASDTTKFGKSTVDSMETESKNKELSKADVKKSAVKAELKKLSMSIVGAEEFFATNSKRKRREKKLDLDENKETPNKEKKIKGLRDITSNVDKNNLTIPKRESENKNDDLDIENNETVELKKRLGSVRRKSISGQRSDSPLERQVFTPTYQLYAATIENDNNVAESSNSPSASKTEEVRKNKLILCKKKNSLSAKKNSSEEEEPRNTESKTSRKSVTKGDIHTESHSTEQVINKYDKNNSVAEATVIGLTIPESVVTKTKELNIIKKDVTDMSNETTPITPRKRGRPCGSKNNSSDKQSMPKTPRRRGGASRVKESSTNKESSADSTPKDRSMAENKLELHLHADDNYTESVCILDTIDTLSDKRSIGIDNVKSKIGGRSKRSRNSVPKEEVHCKPYEFINIDVYQFDTEQEMISESEIIPLRSPNKDHSLTLATNNVSDLHVKKDRVISETSKKETSSTGRKSKRKIIPTKKLTQFELFKSSESPKHWVLKSSKQKSTAIPKDVCSTKNENLPDEKSTQSELFKHTDEKNDGSQPMSTAGKPLRFGESDIPSNPTECDEGSSNEESIPISKRIQETNIKTLKPKSDIPLEQTYGEESSSSNEDHVPLSKRIQKTNTKTLKHRVSKLKIDASKNSVATQDVIKPTKTENSKLNNINIIRKGIKRNRPSSDDDDDDIIESSQDSNVSAAKLKLSLIKRTSCDKPVGAEVSQNIEENKNPEEIDSNLSTVNSNKDNVEVTPEETKKKRGRPAKLRGRPPKSPSKTEVSASENNISNTNVQIHNISADNDITKIDVTPEAKQQENLKNESEHQGSNTSSGQKEDKKSNFPETVSQIHMWEGINRAAVGMVNEKLKRNSPRKPKKESEELTQVHEVKRQIFPQELNEPMNLDTLSENLKQRTQSQDTQTQETESMDIHDEIQLQLNLPQKPVLDETDKKIARMDTASMSLGNSEELKGFDLSSGNETTLETNRTVLEIKTLIPESENVIESSEEPKLDCKRTNQAKTPAIEDKKIIPVDTKDMPESESVFASTESMDPLTEPNEILEIAETECCNTQDSVNMEVLQGVTLENESPVKRETAIKCIGTPGSLESSLPSSPLTGDTPIRTTELLNCTSDISPIGSKSSSDKSSSDDEFVEQRKLMPVALKFDEDVDHETNKEKSPEKADDAPRKIDETSPEKAEKNVDVATSSSPPKDGAKTDRDIKTIADRSNRFFDMIKSGSPRTLRLFGKRKSGLNMSPSASRIKKLMSNVKAPSQSEISDNVSQEDVLTFTREVPSPLAVPRSSILKRKHADTIDDGLSPCPKRKRVNFSDPCTTSKKVFIKEDNALQNVFGAGSDDDIDKQFLEVLAANNIETQQTESDSIETEQSLQLKNPFLLRDDVPIYPELVDCEESVTVISRKLTSPMFVNALPSKLNGKNIKTIGDLAKQSEVSIARLPFKAPMVANVYKALDNYYHKNFKSKAGKEKREIKCNGEPESVGEVSTSARLEVALVKMDVKDELLKVMERAKCQNVSTDTLCSLLFTTIDHKEVLKYVKTHSNVDTKDIVDEKDFPKLVKHIIETVGLPKVFEILTESLESSEDESVYFDCMIKHSIEKKPLSSLIEKRSLAELQAALWENVDNGTYTKKDLFSSCFLPFVNSIDLTPVFNKMTVVQIEEIVIKRLKTEDYPMFIGKILTECADKAKIKDEILSHCTISEMTSNIIKKGTPQEVISSFTYMFLSAEKGTDDLMQVFRLVSDSLINVLPPSKLMELSLEFQKKIPIKD